MWIDNQFLAWTADGRFDYGYLETVRPAWIEIQDFRIENSNAQESPMGEKEGSTQKLLEYFGFWGAGVRPHPKNRKQPFSAPKKRFCLTIG